ncbi:hypothetical protein [Glacieibacterium sp.]|uniref:hypothetical protein n=1 Tax=Glacieibacterium sp. TaxID=2860237 RepID=UPI003B0096F8
MTPRPASALTARLMLPLGALLFGGFAPSSTELVAHGMPGQPAIDRSDGRGRDRPMDREGEGGDRGRSHSPMFGTMSDAGRRIITGAMYWMPGPPGSPPVRSREGDRDRDQVHAARDRILTLLSANRLDVVALRRAMDEERQSASQIKLRHQAAMLAAFQRLSLTDRRAFVADARNMRERMERPTRPPGR